MARLTAQKVKNIKAPGHYSDGGGLLLRVNKTGSKCWILRVQIDKRRRDYGLGSVSMVTLADARHKAHEARRAIRLEGRNPFTERDKEQAPTFSVCVGKTYDLLSARWRSEKTRAAWRARVHEYATPRIGDSRIDAVSRDDMLGILGPIWTTKPEVARKLRQSLKAVFKYALSCGYVDLNLAGEVLDGALPSQPKVKANFRALPYSEVSDALEIVAASGASMSAKLATRFLVLTAGRSGEVRGASWSEIDLEARTWTILGERMKTGREHRVPLNDAALDVLRQARTMHEGELIFPSPMKMHKPLSDMALTKMLRDVGLAEKATIHGFRSSFRDWCADTGKPREIAEAALAHVVGGVEGAYFRSDLYERRRAVMEQWASYLSGEHGGKVVRLHA